MNLLAILRMKPNQAVAYLTPLLRLREVESIHVVRPNGLDIENSKVRVEAVQASNGLRLAHSVYSAGSKILQRTQIDAIVSINALPYGAIAWQLAKRWKKPFTVSMVGLDLNRHCRAWYGASIRHVLRQSSSVTVTGDDMLARLRSWGLPEDSTHTLPHSLDTTRFSSTKDVTRRRYAAVFVGDLIPLKRVDVAIETFVRVRAAQPDAHFAIIGGGPQREFLEAQVRRAGATDFIEFTGRVDNVEVYLQDSKCLVMNSETEGKPFAMLEAMSCGCVPITTSVGSIPEVVNDGDNGFLVDAADAASAAELMSCLLTDSVRLAEMSKAALQIRNEYGWEAAESVWQEILRRVA